MKATQAEKLISRFADAATEIAFIGALPEWSDDPEEQQAINAERRRLRANYSRARNALLRALAGDQP